MYNLKNIIDYQRTRFQSLKTCFLATKSFSVANTFADCFPATKPATKKFSRGNLKTDFWRLKIDFWLLKIQSPNMFFLVVSYGVYNSARKINSKCFGLFPTKLITSKSFSELPSYFISQLFSSAYKLAVSSNAPRGHFSPWFGLCLHDNRIKYIYFCHG